MNARFVSPRTRELRWSDVRRVLPHADQIEATVLTATLPITLTVAITKRWAGRGWGRLLSCPRCSGAAKVLRVAHWDLLCARCAPRRHPDARRTYWTGNDGALETQLVRVALSRSVLGRVEKLCGELEQRDRARVGAAMRRAREMINGADAVFAARREKVRTHHHHIGGSR